MLGRAVRAALETAASLIERPAVAAQACAVKDGQVIMDRSFGCTPDDEFLIFGLVAPEQGQRRHPRRVRVTSALAWLPAAPVPDRVKLTRDGAAGGPIRCGL